MNRSLLGAMCLLGCASTSFAADNGYPPFSWDRVPLYIHFGKTSAPLTDDELRFVAERSNFVCLEKGHARNTLGSTEKGAAHDARRLKELNPDMKVLFYWNTFLNYELYDACDDIAKHPDWVFRDKAGEPIYKTGKLEQYNLLNPEFRAWWASIAGDGVKKHGCDGIFMDAVNQAKRPLWMTKGWGAGNESKLTDAVIDMMKRANKEMGEGTILLYNGHRSLDRETTSTGDEYLDYADGFKFEHFGAFHSRSKESMARDIAGAIRASKAGKILTFKGWPDPEFFWNNADKMKLPADQLAREAREKITFSLACYLVSAGENAYFCYSWGYREQHGSLVDYPELSRPLGPPLGDAKRDGWRYTREFQHVKVVVDLSTREASIKWDSDKSAK